MTPSLPPDSERLSYRPLGREDVGELVTMHEDPVIARFMGTYDRAWFERYIEIVEREWDARSHSRVAVVERASGGFVGRSGLKFWPEFDETEVGWALHAAARGKGYATEAGAASLRWGFEQLGLDRITANIVPANVASNRVAERLGMAPIRRDLLMGEEVVVFAIDRADYISSRG